MSRAQVALAWMLANLAVTSPIIGATKVADLEDAITAVDLDLSAEEIARLEEPDQPHEVSGVRLISPSWDRGRR